MRENKPTVNQISRRIGSELKMVNISSFEQGYVNIFHLEGIWEENIRLKELSLQQDLNHFKPILRNLSSLTKPIKHKGETFVPIEKLKSMMNKIYFENKVKMYIDLGGIDLLPYFVIELLISWNFRIDEKEGTFIYAEDLETNPYE
jgi:hypothetical protein